MVRAIKERGKEGVECM